MDKEIIIDGVDVAGCEFYENGNCNCVDARNCEGYIFDEVTPCIGNPECNFKQLARKTQECEELEKTYDTLQNTWIKQSKHLHRYKQALEKIKFEVAEELKTLEADCDEYGTFLQIAILINEVISDE